MGSVSDRLDNLKDREAKAKALGGSEQIARQKAKGKLTARERLELLFDPGTFEELDMFVASRSTDFDMQSAYVAAEGVITGHGLVDGRQVCAYSQDFTSMGGTLGEVHAKKIWKVLDLALKTRCPVVGLNDSGGARIQEGVDALSGYGGIFYRNTCASGVIPQISAIMGPTAGGAVYSPALMDWVFMVKNSSYMFITGPDVVRSVIGEEVSAEKLGGAVTQNSKSGVAHFACDDDASAIQQIKELLSYLPSSNDEAAPPVATMDEPDRTNEALDTIIPDSSKKVYDMMDIIRSIVDDGVVLEPHSNYAKNMIVCFARMDGQTVGIIANQPKALAGCLDVNASDKASRFIRFCDAFNIPLVTLVDVPGYLPGTKQEWTGIIRHGAKLLYAYSEATVPKVTLITRKAYGGAYLAMCSKDLGADYVMAWPTAEIAVMGGLGAASIIHRREINGDADPKAKLVEKIKEYNDLFCNPYIAASRGYVDAVISPRDSRARIISALALLETKYETRPDKKHGNMPV
ncbi:MAG: methylmalonyl-CoA carboxyltransferase [Chloroflexi bacterium]|nr:methylmalonyl-CoA carboxyltransferase [Chloroflexota bacterium]